MVGRVDFCKGALLSSEQEFCFLYFCEELKRNLAIHHNRAAAEFLSGMSLLFPCSTRPPPCPFPLPPDLESPLLFSFSPLFAQLLPQLGVLTVAPRGCPRECMNHEGSWGLHGARCTLASTGK